MVKTILKVDIAPELKPQFELALGKVVSGFIEEVEFKLADNILSKSKLTKKQAFKLADELKSGMTKRHGLS